LDGKRNTPRAKRAAGVFCFWARQLRLGGPNTLKRELRTVMGAAPVWSSVPLGGAASEGGGDQHQLPSPMLLFPLLAAANAGLLNLNLEP
jgi:hypothetical protein